MASRTHVDDTHEVPPVLRARGISKAYGDSLVLSEVDLDVLPGEVHALLGENGAGKSTLIKVVAGVVVPDGGTVTIAGDDLHFGSPHAAMAAGVATLYQELATVGGLTVAENVFLGRQVPSVLGAVRWRELNQAARALFAELGQDIDVTLDVDHLSPVGKSMTALARALSQESRVLILDEPTAALTDSETEQLFAAIRRLQARGVGVVYVSHRLEEVFGIADRYTVLRNGRRVAGGWLRDTTVDAVITAMAGRPVNRLFPPKEAHPSDVVLEAVDLTGRRSRAVCLEVRAGEVVGIAGLAGAGRSEVLRMIAGAQVKRGGHTMLRGRRFDPRSPKDAQRAGVVLLPQERRSEGLIPDSVERNLNATTIDGHTSFGGFVISRRREIAHARGLWNQFNVHGKGLEQEVFDLSGGNQQKIALAKYLALKPKVLLLDEPTRGVDVSTKAQIYALIREQATRGCAVLMVSSELAEIVGLCDRVVVLHEGRLSGSFDGSASEEQLLHACYGRSV